MENAKDFHDTKSLMHSLKTFDVYRLNLFKILQLMFDTSKGNAPNSVSDKFERITHNYPTQYSEHAFKLPKIKTTLSKYSLITEDPSYGII